MENSMGSHQLKKKRKQLWLCNATPEYIFKENESTNSKKYV